MPLVFVVGCPIVRVLASTLVLCLALAVAGCGGGNDSSTESTDAVQASTPETTTTKRSESSTKKTKPKVKVPKGAPPKQLVVKELEEGTGAEAKAGDEVAVQYVGVDYKNGKEFDSSWSRHEPFVFQLGVGQVIPGWDQGIEGMKVGGRRELIIPPELAYGEAGSPPAIGPNETLVFVVDLLSAR
jgi:peptidylprolyl isomerase